MSGLLGLVAGVAIGLTVALGGRLITWAHRRRTLCRTMLDLLARHSDCDAVRRQIESSVEKASSGHGFLFTVAVEQPFFEVGRQLLRDDSDHAPAYSNHLACLALLDTSYAQLAASRSRWLEAASDYPTYRQGAKDHAPTDLWFALFMACCRQTLDIRQQTCRAEIEVLRAIRRFGKKKADAEIAKREPAVAACCRTLERWRSQAGERGGPDLAPPSTNLLLPAHADAAIAAES